MSDTPSTATNAYGEGVKWILSIAAAAIGGAFLHLKDIETQRGAVQTLMALSLTSFVCSIWGGMNYLLWLNGNAVIRDREKEDEEELGRLNKSAAPDDHLKMAAVIARIKKHGEAIALAKKAMPTWHTIYTYCFTGAMALATAGLLLSICLTAFASKDNGTNKDDGSTKGGAPPKNADKEQARFMLVYSAVHARAHGREAHTFLMNDETGELWQMMCDRDGRVAFHKVQRMEMNTSK